MNSRPKKISVSPTLGVNQLAKGLREQGREVFHFGFGQSPFPIPTIVAESLKSHVHRKEYLEVNGLRSLRAAIARHTNALVEEKYSEEQVFVGPGSKQLIFSIQRLFSGPLILPIPSWVSYAPQANLWDKRVIWVSPDHHHAKVTASALKKSFQSESVRDGLLLLNYPNNPTGLSYSNDELQHIAAICREHGVIVLSDEIYGLLDFNGGAYKKEERQ